MSDRPLSKLELSAMADALVASGQYRVQRRLSRRPKKEIPAGTELKPALFVDVETTGLDHQNDEIIELAMVPFRYGTDGEIYEMGDVFQAFNQPRKPISPEITRLTGITNEMVVGKAIDPSEVEAFAKDAVLVLAHNAAFDRRFIERLVPSFALKAWGCSQSQIDWAHEGMEGTRLSYLVAGAGYFYDKHRAENDCRAAIELLASPLPLSAGTGLAKLMENARKPSWRIWAENSPFEFKDILKARGYRWNGDGSANPRSWYLDIDDEAKAPELEFLRSEIYQREIDLVVKKIDAYNRFSDRV
jgi:DNA polymerase-3 subunit epsilon